MRAAPVLLAGAILTACAGKAQSPVTARAAPDWRAIASDDDRERLRNWRSALVVGLARARAAGHGSAIARKGALLDPDAALTEPMPPVGRYRCNVTKLGAKSTGMLDYVDYPNFECRIEREGATLMLRKITGSQRQVGLIYPDPRSRTAVFLGSMVLGDEQRPLRYGADANRDLAGMVQRVGEERWRIVFPAPHFESLVDVLELTPVN